QRSILAVGAWVRVAPSSIGEQPGEVVAVAALRERLGEFRQTCVVDPSRTPGDLLDASDLETLPLLDDAHVVARLHHRCDGAGVEPGGAPVEHLHVQSTFGEVVLVHGGDLQLAPGTWADALRDL